jgi:glucokinase
MNSFTRRQFKNQEIYSNFSKYVLGIDVGGTNTNIAFAGVDQEKPILLFSLDFKSQEISTLNQALIIALEYAKKKYDITISSCCIGAPGIVSENHDFAELTNISWSIDGKILSQSTGISSIYIINDFQLIGYGVNLIDPTKQDDIIILKKNNTQNYLKSIKAIIGAGTGLGKCILFYDEKDDIYYPIESEGGHSDFPVYTEEEFGLLGFIKQKIGFHYPITYENVISGSGLLNIYEYLKQSGKYYRNSANFILSPMNISLHRKDDELCKKTFDLFTRIYARCIKNFILDTMALGGVYIAGGIATKNQDLFESKIFKDEVENAYQRHDILNKVPIYLIHNYDISLKGACLAAILKN